MRLEIGFFNARYYVYDPDAPCDRIAPKYYRDGVGMVPLNPTYFPSREAAQEVINILQGMLYSEELEQTNHTKEFEESDIRVYILDDTLFINSPQGLEFYTMV